ncbi:MAG: hypothetical protein GDA68_02895 [Nitrospira sp. CR2.1]|nr:hypothetical protein [Nitrospira sp. CR2.1]
MAGDTENTVSVIPPNDPLLAEYPHFDFQALRREGLRHIGDLSGKVWTDHNAHDPGVTILDELCYALIDLGYRTTLPMEDLLSEPRVAPATDRDVDPLRHENFFTPLEILSCNPTTVLDYRKLLLDVDGVRNAWLEPAETDGPPHLYLAQASDQPSFELQCWSEHKDGSESRPHPVVLNGLYSILIQKETDADDKQVFRSVRERLAAHRNLCEDFKSITILCPLEIGVCADVEIDAAADAAAVYEAIINALKSYIAPELRFYTLTELLDKGRAIEDVFAGRPFLGSRSAGFVDTEELESLPLRDELFGSDLYSAVLGVSGVLAIRSICFQTSGSPEGATIQRVRVPPGFVAEFSLDRTCVQLQTARVVLSLDKERIHRRLQEGGKPKRGLEHLDSPVPAGRYLPDLADYYSIQHDFPLVYGIGKGGLSDKETPSRKAQAKQLKGYLLFYDQLLANYLAQLANLRHVFSLRQESKRPQSAKHTYFSQDLESVPDGEGLFLQHAVGALSDGSVLAVPVADDAVFKQKLEELATSARAELRIADNCGPSPGALPHFAVTTESLLTLRIRQSVREFQQGEYSLELFQDRNGYFFILRLKQVNGVLFVSYRRYDNQDEAREAANLTAFLASQPESYARRIRQAEPNGSRLEYLYDVIYKPTAYSNYLQFLVENPELYLKRREAFLDHLLARFATQFTDYALLRFGAGVLGKSERRQVIEDKSRFLSQVDDLSRNRGRAFNYLQPSWGTENVSGFEKRVSMLAGMQKFGRRRLCKFEVVERFRIEMEGPQGHPTLSSIARYGSKKELSEAKKKLVEELGDPDRYDKLRRRFRRFDPIWLRRIFSRVAADENIEVSRWVYALILRDSSGTVRKESTKTDYADPREAWRGLPKFLKEVESEFAMEAVGTDQKNRLYLDNRHMQCRIEPIITYKWHRYDTHGNQSAVADSPHPDTASAVKEFAEVGDHVDLIVRKEDAALWSFKPQDGYPPLVSIHAFANELEAQRAWLRCKSDGQKAERYRQEPETGGRGTRITLTTEGGVELAAASISNKETVSPDEYIELCRAEFGVDEAELEYPTLRSAFGWRLTEDQDGGIMDSAVLYRDVPGALFGLLDALEVAKDPNNYFEAGTEWSPDYRILLRSPEGLFLATTKVFADEAERKKNLPTVRGRMKRVHPPLVVREEPRRYRWGVYRTIDTQVVVGTKRDESFDSEEAAQADFERTMRHVREEFPSSPVRQALYTVELKQIEHKHRFVYCLSGHDGEALPLLRSEQEFDSDEVKEKYTEFVTALPRAVLEIKGGAARVLGENVAPAVLAEDTEDNRKRVRGHLEYMQMQHGDSKEERAHSKWIYRLLDRDNPIAKSKEFYPTVADAEKAKAGVCNFEPCRVDPKKMVLRVICPELDPRKYHYALYLDANNEDGGERPTLISYLGYDSEDAARSAGEQNWLTVIERATDSENYGPNKAIAEQETYAESTGSVCDKAEGHLAVKPEQIETDIAVAQARCYPVRISYRKDKDGNLTSEVAGYHFRGYDLKTKEYLWRSAGDYATPDEALDAYQLFVTVLGNPDSCRIECDEGKYRIHLVEILAESGEFDTEDKAWDEPLDVTKDECGRPYCPTQGVRLFAETATAEAAFIPVRDGDCYSFAVVGDGYRLARHTCDYPSRGERDEAMETLRLWAGSLEFEEARIHVDEGAKVSRPPDDGNEQLVYENVFLQFHLGHGYFLQSPKRFPELRETDAQKIVDEWVWLASSSRNYWWNGYNLRLRLVKATRELEDQGRNLVIVALVDGKLHIRIFDGSGKKVVDKAENELLGGDALADLKQRLMPLPDESRLSLQEKREIIDHATSIAGLTRLDKDEKKWILVNPLEDDLAIASVERERISGAVEIGEFIELLRKYPVFKKDAGYGFRLYYPENGARLDEKLKICGSAGEQQTTPAYCGRMYVFESTACYPCRAAAENAFKRFLVLLPDAESYHPEEETGLGTFSFSMIDRQQVLASHPHCHPDRTGATRAAERARACVQDEGMHLVEHILLRPQSEEQCQCLLPVCPDRMCPLEWQEDLDPDDPCAEEDNPVLEYVPGSDPYSFWATVVLPSWIERFKNSERRQFFRQMLYREVPAMVGLNIVWLGPRHMAQFEEVLKPWLSSRRCPPVLCEGEKDPFCEMVKQIGGLRNEPPCPDPDPAAAECECLPKETKEQYDECIEKSENLFWLECQPARKYQETRPEVVADHADVAAVRRAVSERREKYLKNFLDVEYAPATSTKSYGQARHFLTNPPSLDAFKRLTEQMAKDIAGKGKRKSEALAIVFSNAFWYLLDHLLQEHPTEVAPGVEMVVPSCLQAMKKRMQVDQLGIGWKGEELGKLLGTATTRAVREYLALIKQS